MTKPMRVDGIDISHHQGGKIDLAGAKKRGLKWMYHKATEGETVKDGMYSRRRAEAKKAGLPFGAYHFARPEVGDAVKEARRFIDVAKPVPGDLRPALDLETDEGLSLVQIRQWCATFVAEIVRLVGVKPIIYTPFDLGAADDGCILWRPRYNNTNTQPVLKWDIWQFSNGIAGVPSRLAGVGEVDLNTMRDGLTVAQMQIPTPKPAPPKPPKKAPKTERVHVAEMSMQFSDNLSQKTSDAVKIFTRARRRGVAWVTGTEAFEKSTRQAISRAASAFGYTFYCPAGQDSWIAVSKQQVKEGTMHPFYTGAIVKGEAGKHSARGIVGVEWDDKTLGHVTVLASHLLLHNDPRNREFTKQIGDLAREKGKGRALVFYQGDQNMNDRNVDTFQGQPLTSVSDELQVWPNTGHGPIDVIASYDRDGRVKAAYVRALDDKEFPLHTDHYLVEAGFDIVL